MNTEDKKRFDSMETKEPANTELAGRYSLILYSDYAWLRDLVERQQEELEQKAEHKQLKVCDHRDPKTGASTVVIKVYPKYPYDGLDSDYYSIEEIEQPFQRAPRKYVFCSQCGMRASEIK